MLTRVPDNLSPILKPGDTTVTPFPGVRIEAPALTAETRPARPKWSRKSKDVPSERATEKPVFPFSALVGQEAMQRALLIAVVDPSLGGVLVFGDRGTGKSTAVRALAALLPDRKVYADCPYACTAASSTEHLCADCRSGGTKRATRLARIPVVDMPLGCTEDRVVGALDLERALTRGEKAFEPGLLARANGGFLYIDEVNLLEDHLVDLLLDVAASGENLVERDGLSIRHPAQFVLIGSGNPEEGELRPQLLDRFGLSVEIRTPTDIATRIEVVKRRDAFERDRAGFVADHGKAEQRIRRQLIAARNRLGEVRVPDMILEQAARLCLALGTDGLRGELTLIRAARATAALDGADTVDLSHLREIAPASLRHRLRRNPLDDVGSTVRVSRAIDEVLGI
jgi:magnesium chelatase subunit I